MQPTASIQERSRVGARGAASRTDGARPVIVAGVVVANVTAALLAASQLINFGVFHLRIQAFDSDYHTSVFGLASLAAQLAVAVASAWRGRHTTRHRWAWFGLGALVAVLAVVRELTTFNATALAGPLLCVFVLLSCLVWRDAGITRAAVGAGLLLMMVSLMLHKVGIASDASTASDYTWPYQIVTVIKHACELAGWTLVATGVLAGTKQVSRKASSTPEALHLEVDSVAS